MQFIEGTHSRRRKIQPSPAPHRSKEVVDENAQVGHVHNKMAGENGQNIRLDNKLHAHMRS